MTETIKILGFTRKRGEAVNTTNFRIVEKKINNVINMWSKFGLKSVG
jgi:hypothetical protein